MTVPHAHAQLGLFAAQWYQPVDTRSQVDRMPGTADADCLCMPRHVACAWPFCPWKPEPKEDE